jgi:quercetin dioxygenase-like cupin family protein
LSRLERGEKGPSIATVVKLTHALGSSVSDLFGETNEGDVIHVKRASRGCESADGRYVVLSHARSHGQAQAFLFGPPPDFGEQSHATHGGEESFFVVSGHVEVEFSDRTIALAAGDFMQFPGHMPHRVRRVSNEASILVVIAGK